MRRSFVVHLALLAALVAGCGIGSGESASAGASDPLTPEAAASTAPSAPERIPLAGDFPVLPGAVRAAMPNDDPGLIGLWTSDQPGSNAYDFFVAALPAAGYPIVGRYPGGAAAVIRFSLPNGGIWQMVAREGGDGALVIEIRLDRP